MGVFMCLESKLRLTESFHQMEESLLPKKNVWEYDQVMNINLKG